jgi:hypothetical protein
MRYLILLVISMFSSLCSAQQIANIKASQVNGMATVVYDLQVPSTQTFFVKLFYSTDGGNSFSDELKFVNGDVRANVSGGPGKKIIWNSKQESGDIEGNVVFKVTAESKAKLPKPFEHPDIKFEFLDLRREGTQLVIDFQITPKKEIRCYTNPGNPSIIYDNFGSKSDHSKTYAEGAEVTNSGSDYAFRKNNLQGIPFKGSISFPIASEASSLALLKICPCEYISFELRNIAIPK